MRDRKSDQTFSGRLAAESCTCGRCHRGRIHPRSSSCERARRRQPVSEGAEKNSPKMLDVVGARAIEQAVVCVRYLPVWLDPQAVLRHNQTVRRRQAAHGSVYRGTGLLERKRDQPWSMKAEEAGGPPTARACLLSTSPSTDGSSTAKLCNGRRGRPNASGDSESAHRSACYRSGSSSNSATGGVQKWLCGSFDTADRESEHGKMPGVLPWWTRFLKGISLHRL